MIYAQYNQNETAPSVAKDQSQKPRNLT
jgi:hypothetical protein